MAAAQKRYSVVLSDVHIGDNSPTCWYQAKFHDEFLNRALQYVVDHQDVVRDVMLLGDMFDVWTYPPDKRPPGMAQILAANPDLLGPKGMLAKVCKALPKEVRIILGNHDGTLTQADIDLLNKNMGFAPRSDSAIRFVTKGVRFVEPAPGLGRTVFSHGHFWCMFNAPDPAAKAWGQLPVGHFVTRAIGYDTAKKLKKLGPGKTVADLPNMGNPNGVDLTAFLNAWFKSPGSDIVPKLLDYMCKTTGMSPTEKILMPDGSESSIVDAKKVYADLFKRWLARHGPTVRDGNRAAAADNWPAYLAWFAQRLALDHSADLVVFGHTHTPVGGFIASPVKYFNSGYECVSRPDFKRKHFTFAVVDLTHAGAEIHEVYRTKTGALDVKPFPAKPTDVVVSPMMDYSCYVRIVNTGPAPLKVVSYKATAGRWVLPPRPVKGNDKNGPGRAEAWLQDEPGKQGSAGEIVYNDGVQDLKFTFRCPFLLDPNAVTSPVSGWWSRVGTGPWHKAKVEAVGHPLAVRFEVAQKSMARAHERTPAAVGAGV